MHPSPLNSLAAPGSALSLRPDDWWARFCGPFLVDASDVVLIEASDDDIYGLDDPLDRYPDGEFDE